VIAVLHGNIRFMKLMKHFIYFCFSIPFLICGFDGRLIYALSDDSGHPKSSYISQCGTVKAMIGEFACIRGKRNGLFCDDFHKNRK
jgi:hypothetical protein